MAGLSQFDYLNSINTNKKDIMMDDLDEQKYPSYMVNRGLSYFHDTVALANLVNQYHHMDNRMKYDFLRQTVRKSKRFGKWFKQELPKDIDYVKEYYNYSDRTALNAMKVMTKEHIEFIKRKLSHGGRKP